MFEIFLYSIFIILASLLGVISVWSGVGRVIERNLNFLVSFSAGVFLIIALQLGSEVLEHANSLTMGLVWIVVGVVVLGVLFRFIPTLDHHHNEETEEHPHTRLDARRIMVGNTFHNIGDGVLLATSFAVSSSLGFVSAISIFVHELVQKTSGFFVFRQAGHKTNKALVLNLISSTGILVGSIGSFLLLDTFEIFELPLLGLSTGAFLVVVFHDLIPHSVMVSRQDNLYWRHIVWFLAGIALMILVNLAFGH